MSKRISNEEHLQNELERLLKKDEELSSYLSQINMSTPIKAKLGLNNKYIKAKQELSVLRRRRCAIEIQLRSFSDQSRKTLRNKLFISVAREMLSEEEYSKIWDEVRRRMEAEQESTENA